MKIRIKGNTIRYRLSKSEVTTLAQQGVLEEKTEFISGQLIYRIEQTDAIDLSTDFAQNTITLYAPQKALHQWAATDEVGMEHYMQLPNGATVYLLLEKDFKCIDGDVKEDQSDYFENPQIKC